MTHLYIPFCNRWERCCRKAGDTDADPAVRVVINAVRQAVNTLVRDPRELAGQLVGRLVWIDELKEVKTVVEQAKGWRCSEGGWWCPAGPAGLVSAASATGLIVGGQTGMVTSVSS